MIAVALVIESTLNRAIFMPAAKAMTGINHVGPIDDRPSLSRLADDTAILDHFSGTEIDLTTAVTFLGFLVGGVDEEVDSFLAYTRGMPHLPTEQMKERGVRGAVVVGSLDQWRVATIEGCRISAANPLRQAFNSIYQIMVQNGFKWLFDGYRPVEYEDGFLLLEQK